MRLSRTDTGMPTLDTGTNCLWMDISSRQSRLVKHYSPSCPHCQQIAPTWQTLYEFYYVGVLVMTAKNRLY